MKVLVAMDEFHGIISSYQANRYVEEAVASQIETADVVQEYHCLMGDMNYRFCIFMAIWAKVSYTST